MKVYTELKFIGDMVFIEMVSHDKISNDFTKNKNKNSTIQSLIKNGFELVSATDKKQYWVKH